MDEKSVNSSLRRSQRIQGKVPEMVSLETPKCGTGRFAEKELDLPVGWNKAFEEDNHDDIQEKINDDLKGRSHASRSSILTTRRQQEASKLRAMEEMAALELEQKRIQLKMQLVRQRLRFEKAVIEEENYVDDDIEDDPKKDVPYLAPPFDRQESVHDWLNGKSAAPVVPVPEPSNNSILEKLLARQSVPKDLPTLSGEPGDRQLFIRQYENSTKMCGLSPEENARLAKCLKGKAYDAVCAMLGLPENVPLVIETLRMSFGRPQMIIKSLISKAKSVPSVSECNPESIVAFSNAVRCLVSTMKSLECNGHMTNPQLMEELVQKLPSMYQMNWCMQINCKENYDLSTFSEWLARLAAAACLMPCKMDEPEELEEAQRPRNLKNDQVKKAGLPMRLESRIPGACIKCKQPGQKTMNCSELVRADLEQRWKFVTENRLCFLCLSAGHQTSNCPAKKECGEHGCRQYHHPMLHKYNEDMTNGFSDRSGNFVGHGSLQDSALPYDSGQDFAREEREVGSATYGN